MIVVDVNLLIYAYNSAAPQHRAARSWLEDTFSGADVVGLPWAVIHGFLRIATSALILPHPYAMGEALAVVDEWLGAGDVRILEPGRRYWSVLKEVLASGQTRGAMVTDAHLAAVAIEQGATLYTADGDFSRFAGLRTINPLA